MMKIDVRHKEEGKNGVIGGDRKYRTSGMTSCDIYKLSVVRMNIVFPE